MNFGAGLPRVYEIKPPFDKLNCEHCKNYDPEFIFLKDRCNMNILLGISLGGVFPPTEWVKGENGYKCSKYKAL